MISILHILVFPPYIIVAPSQSNSQQIVQEKYVDSSLKLKDKSEILTKDMLSQIGSKISPLLLMRPWELRFRINSDGVSLRTFFNKLEKYNPTMLLIQDSDDCIFGALVTEKWHPSKRFYGTGEAFLFTFKVF